MDTNDYLRELLVRNLKQIRTRNSRYSLRKYAYDLNISSGALSEFLNGQRCFTGKTIMKIFSKLKISEEDMYNFESIAEEVKQLNPSSLELPFKLFLSERGAQELEMMICQMISKFMKMSDIYPGPIEIELKLSKKIIKITK